MSDISKDCWRNHCDWRIANFDRDFKRLNWGNHRCDHSGHTSPQTGGVALLLSRICQWKTDRETTSWLQPVQHRVAKTCQPCQPVGANFSRLVLIFGQITRKNCAMSNAHITCTIVPVHSGTGANTSPASTSATSNIDVAS